MRGFPRRHAPVLDDGCNVVRTLARLVERLEGERPDLILAVAFLAVFLEDSHHRAGVGRNGTVLSWLRDRAADGGCILGRHRATLQERGDRVVELVALRMR